MDKVKAFILEQVAQRRLGRAQAKELLLELSAVPAARPDIAIIGMAGRFSAAADVDQFWEHLKAGRDCVRDFPAQRKVDMREILANPYYAEVILGATVDEADLDRIWSRSGYLDSIDRFDAHFFGIAPLEADYLDPHQRIGLEVAHAALEDAGYGGSAAAGSRTGVFLGRDQTNYSYYRMFSARNPLQLAGSWEGLVASRISYVLDLTGPCLMTDTACSAGAVSIHQAIQSLQYGECDMALAGGLNLSQVGEVRAVHMRGATMDSVESDDYAVRTFDARANGTVWGEGAGMVVLKPLARALADGDHVRAVVTGSAINNDGTSSGITAPRAELQERVILDAWARAGVDPETITYVEAHGTGTVLGDPIEAKALTNAFRRHTSRRQFCGIGSLKTSMGHMVGASGVAAVTKVVKALESGTLAPSTHFDVPNPYIDFTGGPLYVADRLTPWETAGAPRRAGVSSFGFVRTNCHLVLEEAPRLPSGPATRRHYVLTLSARTDPALRDLVDRYARTLPDRPWSLPDTCFTTNVGRGHHEHRIAIVAASREQLVDALDRLRRHGPGTDSARGIHHGVHAVVSDRKAAPDPGDVTRQAQERLSARAAAVLAEQRPTDGSPDGLAELAALYVRGARIDLARLYAGEQRRRVPLPTYPFTPTRHWADPLRTQVVGFGVASAPEHPLLGGETHRSADRVEFESSLSPDRHWVLDDHRIEHRPVLPGTTYLEMVRAAHAAVAGDGPVRFENVFFLVPLGVAAGTAAIVRTTLDRVEGGHMFRVASRHDDTWVVHAEGRVAPAAGPDPGSMVEIDRVRAEAAEVVDPVVLETDSGAFRFGPRWDGVRAEWRSAGQTLALLRLPPEIDAETGTYGLHPAMLDNAVNLASQIAGQTYLPYRYKEFVLHRRAPEAFYSLIRPPAGHRPDGGTTAPETMTFDVDLCDLDGRVFGRIDGYTVKRVDRRRLGLEGPRRITRLAWRAAATGGPPVGPDEPWAVVLPDSAAGRDLLTVLRRARPDLVVCHLGAVTDPDRGVFAVDDPGVRQLCDRLRSSGARGLLVATDPSGSGSHGERRAAGMDALFELYRGLLTHRVKLPLGLRLLTRDAWQVHDGDPAPDPYAAATAMLAVVIGQEHLPVEVVDAAADADPDVLARECLVLRGPSPRAVRGGTTLSRHLVRAVAVTPEEAGSPYADRTFLVTGGTGGLGLILAEEMAARGAARIVLVGRREPGADTARRIDAMGVAEHRLCDVSRAVDVAELGERLLADGVVLDGIVHAAGVAGDGFLATKERSAFDAVLAPKVDGAVAVLELARAHPDAVVVFFSSIAAVIGGHGQGDYSCANAFLDALAARARADGVHAISVDWPTWTGTGMAVDHGVDADDAPFAAVTVREGLAWLEHVLRHPDLGAIPAAGNAVVLRREHDSLPFAVPPEILDAAGGCAAAAPVTAPTQARLTGLAEPTPTEQRVADIYAAVLGLGEVDAHAGFHELGGNSLMTAELLAQMEAAYPDMIDVADLFSYSTVRDLAAFVDEQRRSLGELLGPGHDPDDGDDDGTLREVLDEIGDAELFTLFGDGDRSGGRT